MIAIVFMNASLAASDVTRYVTRYVMRRALSADRCLDQPLRNM